MTTHPQIKDLKQVLRTSYAESLYTQLNFKSIKETPKILFKNYPLP